MSLIYYIIIEIIVLFSLLSCNESSNSLNNTPDLLDDSLVETSGPLKIVGNKLLYANETAQRFQIIEVAELNNPRLVAQITLLGYPYEFYVRGKQYVLLQHLNWLVEGNRLTVIQQQPEGRLITRQDFSLPGNVVTSQQRGQFIYVVTRLVNSISEIHEITVFKWNAQEQLEIVDKIQSPGSLYETAIFPDYLVLTYQNYTSATRQIQVIDLSQPNDPLVEFPSIPISGDIYSALHFNVFNKQLRLVYSLGSNIIVASYDLSSPAMALIGEVNLTPGTMDSSSCLGTHFVDNRAFVVTSNEGFCNLWVIDLSNPSLPQIMSKLEISDRVYELSFHDNHLLAVVNDNQWVNNETTLPISKVALSRFDVTLPNQPILIAHFVPLAEQATESRLTDAFGENKPVLLLDWQQAFAILLFNFVETETHSHLQRVSLANNQIEAAGRFDSPISLQQVFAIAPDSFVALGDQVLLTLRWQADQFQQLGQLELAADLTWLKLENGELWAVATNGAHYRLYRYTLPNLELPGQQWTLPRNDYQKLLMDPPWAGFYNYDTTLQLIDISTGQLYPPQTLLEQTENKVFRQPFVYKGWFYLAEQLPSDQQKEQFQWVLHSWNLQNLGETLNRFIPGNPENLFIANGELITQEATSTGQLRLNRLTLDIEQAHLLYSYELPCPSGSPVFWNGESIYVNCLKEYKVKSFEPWGPIYDNNQELVTQILQLNPGQNFASEGNWIVAGVWGLQAVAPQTILLIKKLPNYPTHNYPIHLPDTYCEVYRLIPGQEAQLLKQLETCPMSDNFVLTPNQVWMTQGLAGIKEVSW